MAFGEHASPVDTIRAILDEYPFSIGLLREILQNSDDAGASKQKFILDKRSHPQNAICDPALQETQGPALLAYNNAVFSKNDWAAIQSLHRSSKRTDTSKIGKFGIGFRSCYHITDNPQILSGNKLGILDPHHLFDDNDQVQPGGVRMDLAVVLDKYKDHLEAFSGVVSEGDIEAGSYPGTVFRLPLRLPSTKSEISDRSVDSADIQQLFDAFVTEEIGSSMLFLRHIRIIEVIEIDEDGNHSTKGVATRTDCDSVALDEGSSHYHRYTIDICGSQSDWVVIDGRFDLTSSMTLLAERAGCDISEVANRDKLRPELSLALPTSAPELRSKGKLFTYLPLPITTGFPCHVHSLFALTPSRQNLRNAGEAGLVDGSRDSILVHWNELIFSEYLPKVWAQMLSVVVSCFGWIGHDIYSVWPPQSSDVKCGESTYWSSLLRTLFDTIIQESMVVWPIVGGDTAFHSYSMIVFAPPALNVDLLAALIEAGVQTAQPPCHIFDLVTARLPSRRLSPVLVHDLLSLNPSRITNLSQGQRCLIMSYLFTANNVELVTGLPLFELVDTSLVAISRREHSTRMYMLAIKFEAELFGAFDLQFLNTESTPSNIVDALLDAGTFNIQRLSPTTLYEHLRRRFSSPRLHTPDDLKFSLEFWDWASQYSQEDLQPIMDLCMVPSKTMFRGCKETIFSQQALDPPTLQAFQKLQVPLAHVELTSAALRILTSLGSLQSASDIAALSQHLDDGQLLSDTEADAAIKHLTTYLSVTYSITRLSAVHRQNLQKLSIYKTLPPSVPRPRTSLLGCNAIYLLDPRIVGGPIPLPAVNAVLFLDGTVLSSHALSCISSGWQVRAVSQPFDPDLLKLTIENFASQTPAYRLAFLRSLSEHRDHLPPYIFDDLSNSAFIRSAHGVICRPRDLVDPVSMISPLFPSNSSVIPCDDAEVISVLQELGLFQSSLTVDIARERVEAIQGTPHHPESITIAKTLLCLIQDTNMDCSKLDIHPETPWLPTEHGLKSPRYCTSPKFYDPKLYDKVLYSVCEDAPISSSLRSALGWANHLPWEVVVEQFQALVNDQPGHVAFEAIITELASRDTSQHLNHLIQIVHDRPWVPTVSGQVKPSAYVLMRRVPEGLPQFCQVSYKLLSDLRTDRFLRSMGCTDGPSMPPLMAELALLNGKSSPDDLTEGVALLKLIAELKPSPEHLASLWIPDIHAIFRPFNRVHFNDSGNEVFLLEDLGNDSHIAHPLIDDELASKLRLGRLVLDSSTAEWDSLELQEGLVDRIRGILQQYTEQQAISEFLANACDANATEFSVCVDERPACDQRVMNTSMRVFQRGPSLVVYNNRTFSDADFKGLHNIARGGKQERSDTIGQFGLGSLAMYHFCEVAMIVSGEHVLFLDPSRQHLPQNRTSVKLSLNKVARSWPDHLGALEGIYKFDPQTSYYDGTLFRLPLRSSSHIKLNSSILSFPLSATRVLDELVQPFASRAIDCMLFTQIQTISAHHRENNAAITQLWSANSSTVHDSVHEHSTIRIEGRNLPDLRTTSETWLVTSVSTAPPDDIAKPLAHKPYRLRCPTRVALATQIPSVGTKCVHRSKRLFSTLPLPIPISLPANISAPFILAPDRRNIRLDEYDNDETRYNRWLLRDVVPQLYISLLDFPTIKNSKDPFQWWPRKHVPTDTLACLVVDAFYSSQHLGASDRNIFQSAIQPGNFVGPRDAVSLMHASTSHVLKMTGNTSLVELPRDIGSLAVTLRKDDIPYVKEQVMRMGGQWFSARVNQRTLSIKDINALVTFIGHPKTSQLDGLPLLPLADGSFRNIEVATPGSPGAQFYYVVKDPHHRELFKANCLTHPDFDTRLLVGAPMNISLLDSAAVGRLIAGLLPTADDIEIDAQSQWVLRFWDNYCTLRTKPSDIDMFPLIPTSSLKRYISLRHLTGATAPIFLVANGDPSWFPVALSKLSDDIRVVVADALPPSLQDILVVQLVPRFTLDALLSYLQRLNLDDAMVQQMFRRLGPSACTKLANWIRDKLRYSKLARASVVRSLPIWPVLGSEDLKPASEVNMLPSGIFPDVVQFLNITSLVVYSTQLVKIGIQPMGYQRLAGSIEVKWHGVRLAFREELQKYRHLLSSLASGVPTSSLLVPDDTSRLVRLSTLYTRELVFTDAFDHDPTRFLHSTFSELEPTLRSSMNRADTLNIPTFQLCAEAVCSATNSHRKTERALTLFRVYCFDLPLRVVDSLYGAAWHRLSPIKFIPHTFRNPQGLHNAQVAHLPALHDFIAPDDMVRPEYAPIAWSQRVIYDEVEYGNRILLANPDFGVPNASDVVEHLRVLAKMARAAGGTLPYPNFLKDLTATYEWLNAHTPSLAWPLACKTELLFLNVDDATRDIWTWRPAADLFFNIVDSDTVWAVRTFLLPYKNLLLRAGVDDIINPSCPAVLQTPAEAKLQAMRSKYQKMREQQKLTDVVFRADGKELHAHRSFLATFSDPFELMFCGGFTEAAAQAAVIDLEYDHTSVAAVLDYLYQDKLPDTSQLNHYQMLDILSLAHYWELAEMHQLIQRAMIEGQIIQPYTYIEISKKAVAYDAELLLRACEEYRLVNASKKGFGQLRDAIIELF